MVKKAFCVFYFNHEPYRTQNKFVFNRENERLFGKLRFVLFRFEATSIRSSMNVDHGRIQPHFEKQTNFKVIVKIEQGDKNDKSIIILFY